MEIFIISFMHNAAPGAFLIHTVIMLGGAGMITISLCMIVRDEEAVIARCLHSVREIADEIIVVDTGSEDQTKEIAHQCGAKVFDLPWEDNFAAARNHSFDQATMEYILWLDADDVLDEENIALFKELKKTLDPSVDVVMMRYHVAFDPNGKPTFTFFRERLVRRLGGFRWFGRVHEAIISAGTVIRSPIAIRHEKIKQGDSCRNLRIYERMLAEGETLEPRHRYYFSRELLTHNRLDEAIVLLRQSIDDPNTWIENRIGACRDLASCLLKKGDENGALEALLKSIILGEPKAEVCCDIGNVFLSRNEYKSAAFWYRAAPECSPSEEGGGFASPECRGYIPYMQLCVCYDRLGQHELAEMYNEKAASFKEGDPAVLQNRTYFSQRRQQPTEAHP